MKILYLISLIMIFSLINLILFGQEQKYIHQKFIKNISIINKKINIAINKRHIYINIKIFMVYVCLFYILNQDERILISF